MRVLTYLLRQSINRNIVECKDTKSKFLCQSHNSVLIETSWNVKKNDYRVCRQLTSINRNIVECKVNKSVDTKAEEIVLIETSWNVKM